MLIYVYEFMFLLKRTQRTFVRERERDYFNPIICPKNINVYHTCRIIHDYKLIATKSCLLSPDYCQKMLQHQSFGGILWHLCSALISNSGRLCRTQMDYPYILLSKRICCLSCSIWIR